MAKKSSQKQEWPNCVYCEEIFGKRVQTNRYCNQCGRAFCEGIHGTFRGHGICVSCYKLKGSKE